MKVGGGGGGGGVECRWRQQLGIAMSHKHNAHRVPKFTKHWKKFLPRLLSCNIHVDTTETTESSSLRVFFFHVRSGSERVHDRSGGRVSLLSPAVAYPREAASGFLFFPPSPGPLTQHGWNPEIHHRATSQLTFHRLWSNIPPRCHITFALNKMSLKQTAFPGEIISVVTRLVQLLYTLSHRELPVDRL